MSGASCPAVSGLSSASLETPRSPGLQPGLYPGRDAFDPPVQAHRALGAAHERALVEHELAADRALERRPSQDGEELLFERPVEWRERVHSSRNTPTTLPRTWTCGAKIGSRAEFSGCNRMRPLSRKKRLTVASSAVSSSPARATTISPSRASRARRTTTTSPSRMPASIIESPLM